MHSRMRHRVSEFQKVLNRAKTEAAVVDRKTARCDFVLAVCMDRCSCFVFPAVGR